MVEITITDMAHGGEGVGRVDGKVHFVAGAMPGETVVGEIARDGGGWARVTLTSVKEESGQRVDPPCSHFGVCGGCQWQFADYRAQLDWKMSIVESQLSHLGGISVPPVTDIVPAGPAYGYRNRMDFTVHKGRAALRKHRSRDAVPLDECLLMHPLLGDLFASFGDLSGVKSATIRAGIHTGERMIILTGEAPPQATQWDANVVLRNRSALQVVRGERHFYEEVAGTRLRISADAFFQNNTAGAETLVRIVGETAGIGSEDTMLDAYAGGGLFSATVGKKAGRVIAIDSSRLAVADLHSNLSGMPGVQTIEGRVEEKLSTVGDPWDVVIADPSRTGLGVDGIAAVTRCWPRRLVYVSCDPASLARDAKILDGAGYQMVSATLVDLFPQTFHIETIAVFDAR